MWHRKIYRTTVGKLTFGDKTYSNYVLSFRFPENQQNIEWFMIPHVEWSVQDCILLAIGRKPVTVSYLRNAREVHPSRIDHIFDNWLVVWSNNPK